MKKVLFIGCFLLLALSCIRDIDGGDAVGRIEKGGRVTISFSVPGMPTMPATRASELGESTSLENLYVAVFGRSGYLKEYVEAELVRKIKDGYEYDLGDGNKALVDLYEYSVSLAMSDNYRSIHFLGNSLPVLDFGDAAEVLPNLLSEIGKPAYWQMIEVPNILPNVNAEGKYIDYEGAEITDGHYLLDAHLLQAFQKIPLIRNYAKIKVKKVEDKDFEKTNFKPISYAVINVPKQGSIVPYSPATGFIENYHEKTFNDLFRTLKYPGRLVPGTGFDRTVPSKEDFENCKNGVVSVEDEGSVYLYERSVPTKDIMPTCLIVYGHYHDYDHPAESTEPAADGFYYYKFDLIENGEYYPIYRNLQYSMEITKIRSIGHATPEAAAHSAGSSDISADINTQHLADISDGTIRLAVQPGTEYVFHGRQTDNVMFKAIFFSDAFSSEPNIEPGAVTVERRPTADGSKTIFPENSLFIDDPVDDPNSDEYGFRTIHFSTIDPTSTPRVQAFRVTGTYQKSENETYTLYRDIVITLQSLQSMRLSCTETVPRTRGAEQILSISIPDGLSESMFPLDFNIEAKDMTLTPDTDYPDNLPVSSGPSLIDPSKTAFHFGYTLTLDDYYQLDPWTDHTDESHWRTFQCHFKTTRVVSATTIHVSSEYFIPASISFSNPEIDPDKFFYVEAVSEGGCTLSFNRGGGSMQYYISGGSGGWTNYTQNQQLVITKGQRVFFKSGTSEIPTDSWSGASQDLFTCSGEYNIGGNIASLLVGDEFEDFGASRTNFTFTSLFQGETGLKEASELVLPMEQMALNCYKSMFEGCTNLTKVPALNAEALAKGCYQQMFKGCENLTSAPNLPATIMAESCYAGMFSGCKKLTSAPALPATKLAASCYIEMFLGCTNLGSSPLLPAPKLVNTCYQQMFDGCSKLEEIRMLATDITAQNPLTNWVRGVAAQGHFYRSPVMTTLSIGNSGIPTKWENITCDEFCIDMLEDGTVSYSGAGLQYAVNFGEWKDYAANTHIVAAASDRILFKGSNGKSEGTFDVLGNFNAVGNVMSLIAGDNYKNVTEISEMWAFKDLFKDATTLISAASLTLPARTLTQGCYLGMFSGCTSLEYAPTLPARTLAAQCYEEMFFNCKEIDRISCMAQGDFTGNNAETYTKQWLNGVSQTGVFVQNDGATWTENSVNGIPEGWSVSTASYFYMEALESITVKIAFDGWSYSSDTDVWTEYTKNTTLTIESGSKLYFKAEGLIWDGPNGKSAITVSGKFNVGGNLASLLVGDDFVEKGTQVKGFSFINLLLGSKVVDASNLDLPMLDLSGKDNAYKSLFDNCKELVSGPKELPATKLGNTCYRNMFFNCSNLKNAPVIGAAKRANGCKGFYQRMFYNCRSLQSITFLSKDDYLEEDFKSDYGWVQGVNGSGIFYCPEGAAIRDKHGIYGIPENWSIEVPQ